MRGRKPTQESRSAELRQSVIEWKQSPEGSRPSLRALARQLGTSHQLLKHYLDGLEKWRYMERHRKATEESAQIIARAIVEGRPMTEWEEQRYHACAMAAIRAKGGALVLGELARLKQEARRGPLNPAQVKLVKILAKRGFTDAQELLDKLSRSGARNCMNNLPAISGGVAKSFRTVSG
jgi:hypothetical protein